MTASVSTRPLAITARSRAYRAVLRLAAACRYDRPHCMHTTRLARRLFDDLRPLHNLTATDRFRLECAALLHDIGWLHGRKGHHKQSLRIILDDPGLCFNERERLIIGGIARYHRRAEPSPRHAHFRALDRADRKTVRRAAALLRLADGLDNEHRLGIKNLTCRLTTNCISITCSGGFATRAGRQAARAKALMLEKVFKRRVEIVTGGRAYKGAPDSRRKHP